ncbi:MAG: AMP-dependent synthetase/ligase [Myxococcales bacterium]
MIAREQHTPEARGTNLSLQTARTLVDLLILRGMEPSRVAARHKVAGLWREPTWGELLLRVRRIGAGLETLGVGPGDRVAIFSATRYEWALANFATFAVGATVVPIYASNSPEESAYILRDSGAKAVFVDDDRPEGRLPGRLARIRQIRETLPELRHVIAFDVPASEEGGWTSLSAIEGRGAPLADSRPLMLEERAALTRPDDLSYIIYTSGTTGTPRGVMLTHANWTSQARSVTEIKLLRRDDTALLFLPLAHSFALVVFATWLGQGIVVAFAESIEKAVDNAGETRSTVMTVVPRVLEKAFNKVVSEGAAQPGVKGPLFAWAMAQFEEYAAARAAGREHNSVQWALAKRLVFSKIEQKVKARFGGYMREFISGGAPLARKIGYFFEICGFDVCEGYGLSETCAPTHVNLPFPGKAKIGTVGLPWPGVEVRIEEDGEVLLRGPQIMKGYLNRPEETAAVLDADGWFHTGDIGEVDSEGFLRITDRKKDLIKTSGGKHIAPQELENGLKSEPLVSQVMIVGDRRKFVSALITVSEENARKLAEQEGFAAESYAALTRRPEVRKRIEAAIEALNSKLPSYATIKKFAILDHDWTQDTGEITPTLKVKRQVVESRYRQIIDGLYDGESYGV